MITENTGRKSNEQIAPIPEVVPVSDIQSDIIASAASTNTAALPVLLASNPAAETKETLELPDLDHEYFHIDSSNLKERTLMTDDKGITFKVNKAGDVRELVSGAYIKGEGLETKYVETDLAGKQFFTPDEFDDATGKLIKQGSATRETEKYKRTMAPSDKSYRDIIDNKYAGDYEAFVAAHSIEFPGVRGPGKQMFSMIGGGFKIICADGSIFEGYRNRPDFDATKNRREGKRPSLKGFGCSVLCVKAKE